MAAEKEDFIKARSNYIELIKQELLGPGSEVSIPDRDHELITNTPNVRYSIGVLFPQNNKMDCDNDDAMRLDVIPDSGESLDENDDNEEASLTRPSSHINYVSVPDEDSLDEEIGLATQNLPSSMGITFFARGNTDMVNCNVSFATYRSARLPDCSVPTIMELSDDYTVPVQVQQYIKYDNQSKCLRLISKIQSKDVTRIKESDTIEVNDFWIIQELYRLCAQLKGGFVRIPHEQNICLDFSDKVYIDNNHKIDNTEAKVTALRRKITDDLYSVTIMLVNDKKKGEDEKVNGRDCLLQPEIVVPSASNPFKFSEYSGFSIGINEGAEEQSLRLLYRNKKIYGSGLGTSVVWDIDSLGDGWISSDFFPMEEVPTIDFNLKGDSAVPKQALSMKYLSDLDNADKEEKLNALLLFVSDYKTWIKELTIAKEALSPVYQQAAQINIEECEKAYIRILSGIEILRGNDNAWHSFELANRAMFMQREHLRLQDETSNKDRYDGDCELEAILDNIDYYNSKDDHFWRPFQLAFLLLSIKSISYDESEQNNPDRDLVDLIWFPTGGGKTEAYLGLTAFTIFYRRLAHADSSGGTSVIMRYTLRLLAAQQFTRASTLICACEYIRIDALKRKKASYPVYPLGSEPITIGLWIGGEHTPNKNRGDKKSASHCLGELIDSTAEDLRYKKDKYNKFQVLKCPWCGTKMVKNVGNNKIVGNFGYYMRGNAHFYMACTNQACLFHDIDLPIQIVDEELYSHPPTLLFGTVDKFAMMAWKNDVGSFFATDSNNRAPELIIQDELHLISGPLGTMVGLYETAIDYLCQAKGVRPKIVASTATIRRAREQCSVLYNRNVVQFPAPGLNAEDSYFAKESPIDYSKAKYGRIYVGLMPSGKTKAMMEVRTMAALLQKIHRMDLEDEIKDKFWTLTVYFNSLRDLGKCRTLVEDDIKDFITRTAQRLGTKRDVRIISSPDELTSRVSTTELNETLEKLEKIKYTRENIEIKKYASNVLLATNMISVGIDVARLNVMLLVGQPKLTSEYIQASSRVGRSFPGVAFALYDGSKSRDRSHFEQFRAYHQSFYKYVEPTGATPFSKPARDRALHAVLVAIMRNVSGISEDNQAGMFDKEYFADRIQQIEAYIVRRVMDIDHRADLGLDDESETIIREMETFFEEWNNLVDEFGEDNLFYGERFMVNAPRNPQGRLLKVFGSSSFDNRAFDTPTSMRNVDSSVASNILIWGK